LPRCDFCAQPREVGRTPLKSINRARAGKLTIVEKPRIPESPAEEQQHKAIKPRAPAPSSTSNHCATLDGAPSEEAPMSRQPIHGAAKDRATKPSLSVDSSAASASVECSPSASTSSTASPALSEGSLNWHASNHGSSRSGSAAPAPGAVSASREGSPFFRECPSAHPWTSSPDTGIRRRCLVFLKRFLFHSLLPREESGDEGRQPPCFYNRASCSAL